MCKCKQHTLRIAVKFAAAFFFIYLVIFNLCIGGYLYISIISVDKQSEKPDFSTAVFIYICFLCWFIAIVGNSAFLCIFIGLLLCHLSYIVAALSLLFVALTVVFISILVKICFWTIWAVLELLFVPLAICFWIIIYTYFLELKRITDNASRSLKPGIGAAF